MNNTYRVTVGFLADARRQVLQLMPGTAVIQRAGLAPDGAGGYVESWAAVAGGTVACRLDPVNLRSQIEAAGGRETMVIEYTVILPYDAPIQAGDRLVIGVAGAVGNPVYEVRRLSAENSWRVVTRCEARRVV